VSQRGFQDRPGEHWTLINGRSSNRRLAIFVHGFLGNHLTTWGRLPELLESNADADPVLADWDFLFIGYSTTDVVTYLDIARLISTQLDLACNGHPPFGKQYKSFALLGHSLGTLGIRQLLCAKTLHHPDLMANLHSVLLFGTPLNGSPLAWFGGLRGGPIAKALEPRNPQLRMLHAWTESAYPGLNWRRVKLVLGTDDKVVGFEHGDLVKFAGDEPNHILWNFDHRSMVKPTSWEASTIRDLIVGALS
jgi:pimeloyl-ACP methyl ester carboxylesterase